LPRGKPFPKGYPLGLPPRRQGVCGPLDPGLIDVIQTGEIAETHFNQRRVRAAAG